MTTPPGRGGFGDLTAADVAALDHAAIDLGVSVVQLMEVAGWQVARCAWLLHGERPGRIDVLAGSGNNGGDGLVAARHLATWGCEVRINIVSTSTLNELISGHARSAQACGAELAWNEDVAGWLGDAPAELVLDGLLGTGLRQAPRDPQAAAIRALNAASPRVLAIDVPSGMDATTGDVFDPCVRATATCTLVALKRGLLAEGSHQHAGDIWVADIGMPAAAWRARGLTAPAEVRGGALMRLDFFPR